ncbi:unnamed protein product, partial [Ectocarpus sp. 8 AP-2014]
ARDGQVLRERVHGGGGGHEDQDPHAWREQVQGARRCHDRRQHRRGVPRHGGQAVRRRGRGLPGRPQVGRRHSRAPDPDQRGHARAGRHRPRPRRAGDRPVP